MPPRPERRPARPTAEQIQADRQRATVQAAEVFGQISQTMLKMPAFTLHDGTACRVHAFDPPKLNADGKLECAFDVLMADGSHLAFTIGHTGWGKASAPGRAAPPPRSGPAR